MYLQSVNQNVLTNNVMWKDLLLKQELLFTLDKVGFQVPSPIQVKTIPVIIQGHNVIYQSKAGSGKTAVFVLSILHMMRPEYKSGYLPHQCLVIAKTRELAYQIAQEFERFSQFMDQPRVRIGCFFGGIPIHENYDILTSDMTPHIIVGTPGRLKSLFEKGFINLNNVKIIIFIVAFFGDR